MTRNISRKIFSTNDGDNHKVFQFEHKDYIYILLGYPQLRGFICSTGKDFSIEVQPGINLKSQRIEFPKEFLKTSVAGGKKELDETYRITEEQFFSTFPEELVKEIQAFPDSHLELTRAVIEYGKDFSSFMSSNRSLAYILVNLEKFNKSYELYNSLNFLKLTLSNKQKEILKRALFPDTGSMVKIISRIPTEILSVPLLIKFRSMLLTPGLLNEKMNKFLSHQKEFNTNLLTLLVEAPFLVEIMNSKSINQLVNSPDWDLLKGRFKKLSSDAQTWRVVIPELAVIDEIDKAEKKLALGIQHKKDLYNKFPEPPLPDTDKIFAIRTVADQKAWSKRQHNCIKDYIKNVHDRKSYFYKIINGFEEATLEIKLHDNEFRKGDLLGTMNHKVSAKTELLVEEWLINYRKLKKKKAAKTKNCQ